MKKLRKVMAVLLTTLLFMTMTSVAHLGYAVDQSTVDKLFSVFDDGSNPMIVIIPALSEPLVRNLRATTPESESH